MEAKIKRNFEYQASIKDVITNGGWSLLSIGSQITAPLRATVYRFASMALGSGSRDRLSNRINMNPEAIPGFFDSLNHCMELIELQTKFNDMYIRHSMAAPVLWTYPNVRVDVEGREEFNAPPHADDWISFRGKTNIVVWTPIVGIGNINICTIRERLKVGSDPYWGVSLIDEGDLNWHQITVKPDEALIFRSDLIHKSSNHFGDEGIRITAQLRYEDLATFESGYSRAITQTISKDVKKSQEFLVSEGYYDNR